MSQAKSKDAWVILDRLAEVILKDTPGCIVDIGMGKSTNVLAKYARQFGRLQLSCDMSSKITKQFGWGLHTTHLIFEEDSLEFLKIFARLHVTPALVFLDDVHTYDHVRQEVYFFLKKLANGGVIFIHDTFLPRHVERKKGFNVHLLREELDRNPYLWTFTWTHPGQAQGCGLTMVSHIPGRPK